MTDQADTLREWVEERDTLTTLLQRVSRNTRVVQMVSTDVHPDFLNCCLAVILGLSKKGLRTAAVVPPGLRTDLTSASGPRFVTFETLRSESQAGVLMSQFVDADWVVLCEPAAIVTGYPVTLIATLGSETPAHVAQKIREWRKSTNQKDFSLIVTGTDDGADGIEFYRSVQKQIGHHNGIQLAYLGHWKANAESADDFLLHYEEDTRERLDGRLALLVKRLVERESPSVYFDVSSTPFNHGRLSKD